MAGNPGKDVEFEQLLRELYPDKEELEIQILNDDWPMEKFFDYNPLFSYFDDWVVVTVQEDAPHFKFDIRKKAPEHVETINRTTLF